jgi:predicted DNA-binding transcriptional regulator AlpA
VVVAERRYLRAGEAAEMLGLKAQTLARWRVEGSPIPFAKLGRAVAYELADILAYAESRKVRSTSESAPAGDASGRGRKV